MQSTRLTGASARLGQRKRVLVVDDDPNVRLLLTITIRRAAYHVLSACDGQEALDLAQAHHPDLVLLDVEMPKLHGYEVCRRLKADDDTKDIVVVMLTAKAQEQDRARGMAAGADGYITKPFSLQTLLELLQQRLAG